MASPLSHAVLNIAVQLSLTADRLQRGVADAAVISDLNASLRHWQSEYPQLEPDLRAISGLPDPASIGRVRLAEALEAVGARLSGLPAELSDGDAAFFLAEMRACLRGVIEKGEEVSPHLLSAPAAALQRRARPAKMRETILIVDDELAIARIIKKQLEKIGYGALLAVSGTEALSIAGAWYADDAKPSLGAALVDMQLPEGSGERVIARLRALDSDLPAVFISGGYAPEGLLQRVERSSYLVKPAPFEEILAGLRRTMDAL